MKYNFEIRSIPDEAEAIEEKHTFFLDGLSGLPAPWRVEQSVEAPDAGAGLSALLKVSKFLGKGLKGEVVYQYRRPFQNLSRDDDWLNISFNPSKLNYEELIEDVFLKYVRAFEGYYAEISDDEFIFLDFDQRRTEKHDKRLSVFRLAPVSYMSEELCFRTFGIDVKEARSRLAGFVDHASLELEGLFVVLTRKPLPTTEMDQICWEARARLAQ